MQGIGDHMSQLGKAKHKHFTALMQSESMRARRFSFT